MEGYYFNVGKHEFFIETKRKRLTDIFIADVMKNAHLAPVTMETIKQLRYEMLPAFCEIKHCPAVPELGVKEHDYYNIYGKNFGGYGSADITDGYTHIIKM